MFWACSAAVAQYGVEPGSITAERPRHSTRAPSEVYGIIQPLTSRSLDSFRAPVPSAGPGWPGVGPLPGGGLGLSRLQPAPATAGGRLTVGDPFVRQRRLLADYSLAGTLARIQENERLPPLAFVAVRAGLRHDAEGSVPADGNDGPAAPELMMKRLSAYRDERVHDGWERFREQNYLGSMAAFKMAETVDRRSPLPRVGQFFSAVASGHYHRAVATLERLRQYDRAAVAGSGMFQYEITLGDLFATEEALEHMMRDLRYYAEFRREDDSAQALYCFALWYRGTEPARTEALGVAERIRDLAPNSPWAGFAPAIRAVRQEQAESAAPGARNDG